MRGAGARPVSAVGEYVREYVRAHSRAHFRARADIGMRARPERVARPRAGLWFAVRVRAVVADGPSVTPVPPVRGEGAGPVGSPRLAERRDTQVSGPPRTPHVVVV